ncbi:fatty acyl-CoA reductase [Scenedesmus sp. PABB004]|nr:fatty acyl-CoA reductase [Scenedesmus sp. PABB004]
MAAAPAYSIAEQLRGATVLLTGATGCVGSLVLEALLRGTDVRRVFVLMRRRGGAAPAERLAQLLQGAAFHQVRDQAALLAKVTAVEGDLLAPALGLSAADAARLASEVTVVVHCAADIRLEVGIHAALAANYHGTAAVLALAARCARLAALVHVSSAFANVNAPPGSVVAERLYPLTYAGEPLDCDDVAQDLLSLPPAEADARAEALRARWGSGFPNNYTLAKHLAEQLVARSGLPAAVVRPSLVGAAAYQPRPGHIGNWAGPIGACAALSLGLYHSLGCVSSQPGHVWDVVPADLAANAVIAAAAATAAGVGGAVAARAGGGGGDGDALLVVHSASSATFPLTLAEGWGHAVDFLRVHARAARFRLSWGVVGHMPLSFRPSPRRVRLHRAWTALKVAAACALLRLLGASRAAARLASGFAALTVFGTTKADRDLVFSTRALAALEAGLPPDERRRWPLVMRPAMPLPGGDGGHGARGVLTWRRYFHSQLAAVFSSLFRVSLPRSAPGWRGGAAVEHDFAYVR